MLHLISVTFTDNSFTYLGDSAGVQSPVYLTDDSFTYLGDSAGVQSPVYLTDDSFTYLGDRAGVQSPVYLTDDSFTEVGYYAPLEMSASLQSNSLLLGNIKLIEGNKSSLQANSLLLGNIILIKGSKSELPNSTFTQQSYVSIANVLNSNLSANTEENIYLSIGLLLNSELNFKFLLDLYETKEANAVILNKNSQLLKTNPGIQSSKQVSFSFWFRLNSYNETYEDPMYFFHVGDTNTGNGLECFSSYGGLTVRGYNTNDELIMEYDVPGQLSYFNTDTWYHIMFAVDLSSTTKRKIYINGQNIDDHGSWNVYTNDLVHLNTKNFYIGNSAQGLSYPDHLLNGELAEFWWDTNYVDLESKRNRNLFFLEDLKKPSIIRDDGSAITGNPPPVYIFGNQDTWAEGANTGSLGRFSAFGLYSAGGQEIWIEGNNSLLRKFLPFEGFSNSENVPVNSDYAKFDIDEKGDVQGDSETVKIGDTSAYFDGNSNLIIQDRVLHPIVDDFTIEGWTQFTRDNSGWISIVGNEQAYAMVNVDTHVFRVGVSDLTGSYTKRAYAPVIFNTWIHWAIVKQTDQLNLFWNGELLTKDIKSTGSMSALKGFAKLKVLGTRLTDKDPYSQDNTLKGWMDEIRFSNIARYTESFEPQTITFNDDENTLVLIHSDNN